MGRRRKDASADPVVFVGVAEPLRLLTIGEDSEVWNYANGPSSKRLLEHLRAHCAGSIVRLRPLANVADDEVERVRLAVAEAGAAKVTVAPRHKAKVVLEPRQRPGALSPGSMREVVLALVGEANVEDREGLRRVVEKLMAEEGI